MGTYEQTITTQNYSRCAYVLEGSWSLDSSSTPTIQISGAGGAGNRSNYGVLMFTGLEVVPNGAQIVSAILDICLHSNSYTGATRNIIVKGLAPSRTPTVPSLNQASNRDSSSWFMQDITATYALTTRVAGTQMLMDVTNIIQAQVDSAEWPFANGWDNFLVYADNLRTSGLIIRGAVHATNKPKLTIVWSVGDQVYVTVSGVQKQATTYIWSGGAWKPVTLTVES